MEEVIREGRWTCPGCGSKVRGRDVKCPGCGQARENVEFEYDEAAPEVDGADAAVAAGGADWVCAYCSTSNRAALSSCGQCGAAGDEGQRRAVSDLAPAAAVAAPLVPSGLARAAKWTAGTMGAGCLGIIAVFVVLVGMAMTSHDEELTVKRAHWTRQIQIEHLIPVQESDWSLPADARQLSVRDEVHHHDQVPTGTRQVQRSYSERVQSGTKRVKTGTKNLGNGYFKDTYSSEPVYKDVQRTRTETKTVYRQVPIYRKKYYYEVDRWKPARTVDTAGDDTTATWGPTNLAGPREREGARTQAYEVLFEGKGKEYPWTPDAANFAKLQVGARFKIEVNGLGVVNGFAK